MLLLWQRTGLISKVIKAPVSFQVNQADSWFCLLSLPLKIRQLGPESRLEWCVVRGQRPVHMVLMGSVASSVETWPASSCLRLGAEPDHAQPGCDEQHRAAECHHCDSNTRDLQQHHPRLRRFQRLCLRGLCAGVTLRQQWVSGFWSLFCSTLQQVSTRSNSNRFLSLLRHPAVYLLRWSGAVFTSWSMSSMQDGVLSANGRTAGVSPLQPRLLHKVKPHISKTSLFNLITVAELPFYVFAYIPVSLGAHCATPALLDPSTTSPVQRAAQAVLQVCSFFATSHSCVVIQWHKINMKTFKNAQILFEAKFKYVENMLTIL